MWSEVDQVVVTINKAPEVNAGLDRVICEGTDVNLNGSIAGSATGAIWSTAGDGTFSFDGDLNAVYTPGAADIASNGVLLTLTTNDPAGPCDAVSDDMFITIDQAPTVDANTYAPVCIGDTILLNGSIGWSSYVCRLDRRTWNVHQPNSTQYGLCTCILRTRLRCYLNLDYE